MRGGAPAMQLQRRNRAAAAPPHPVLTAALVLLALVVPPAIGDGVGCSGASVPAKPVDPRFKAATANASRLPFNRFSWLTTHNSFALLGARSGSGGGPLLAPTNQEDSVTAQLNNGVRGLMLDMYDFKNDVWLCHSFGGNCYDFTAFQPAVTVLKEIASFLAANPNDIITIMIEDYVNAPRGLTNVLRAAGLTSYMFPASQMPKGGGDWPSVADIVAAGHRLLVFTSKRNKEASEGIAHLWDYMVENQYGDGGMVSGKCPNRAESPSLDSKAQKLVLVNYFPDNPNITAACAANAGPLRDMLNTCSRASGGRWPNFVAVDFYKRSPTPNGGAALAVDEANGHLICGCDNIDYCKANATFGQCNVPPPPVSVSSPASGVPNGGGDQKTKATPSSSAGDARGGSLLRLRAVTVAVFIVALLTATFT